MTGWWQTTERREPRVADMTVLADPGRPLDDIVAGEFGSQLAAAGLDLGRCFRQAVGCAGPVGEAGVAFGATVGAAGVGLGAPAGWPRVAGRWRVMFFCCGRWRAEFRCWTRA
ncbi:hypothetical protein AB0J72_54455 [Dactylosporangium sp. NPDC049742]|uniref:hypothetical protein n=1 Tax=Dactylosporangium sp. NPDC049742 TaxID=3154737 RepID=UPI0034391F64